MKCVDCNYDILAKDVKMCPNCFSKNLFSDEEIAEIEKEQIQKELDNKKEKMRKNLENKKDELIRETERLELAGRYEEAALLYEQVGMWKKLGKQEEMLKRAMWSQQMLTLPK